MTFNAFHCPWKVYKMTRMSLDTEKQHLMPQQHCKYADNAQEVEHNTTHRLYNMGDSNTKWLNPWHSSYLASDLWGSKVEFLQLNDVAVPGCVHLAPLGIEQGFKGEDKLQVGSGCHIIVPPESGEVAFRHVLYTGLEGLAHLHHSATTKA